MIATNLMGKWAIVAGKSPAKEIVAAVCHDIDMYVYLLNHDGTLERRWYRDIAIVATPDGWTPGGPYR